MEPKESSSRMEVPKWMLSAKNDSMSDVSKLPICMVSDPPIGTSVYVFSETLKTWKEAIVVNHVFYDESFKTLRVAYYNCEYGRTYRKEVQLNSPNLRAYDEKEMQKRVKAFCLEMLLSNEINEVHLSLFTSDCWHQISEFLSIQRVSDLKDISPEKVAAIPSLEPLERECLKFLHREVKFP